MTYSSNLYQLVREHCVKWELRTFSKKEKIKDFQNEFFEFIQAIFSGKSKNEIGYEYGDVLFTIIRSGNNEKRSRLVRYFFYLFPQKIWLERKLKILDDRFKWWMKNYQMKSIRNYKNEKKRRMLVERHFEGKHKDIWIR